MKDLSLRKSLLFLILSFILIFSVTYHLEKALAKADYVILYVNDFESINQEWIEVGDSPWLNDNLDNYIYSKTDDAFHREFIYTNSSDLGTVESVVWWVEIKGPSARNDRAEFHLKTPIGWYALLEQDDDNDDWTWYNVDVSNEYKNFSAINIARLWIQFQRAGSPATQNVYVRRSYLNISYTPGDIEPEPPGSPPSNGARATQHGDINIFNVSSIDVVVGTLNDGDITSTYFVDGNWYNVSEDNASPGLDIRFNFTGIDDYVVGGCIEVYHTYTGHSHHEVEIQVWNFTSVSWKLIGTILYNETLGWACSGLGPYPEPYFYDGELWARFYHEDTGHLAHELHVDHINLNVINPVECPEPDYTPYIALGIILLLFGLVIGSRVKQ